MIIRDLRPEDYPALAAVHQRQGIVWPERPRSGEGWAEADRNRSPKCQWRRWVAEVDGAVVGFASYSQSVFDYHPQRFYVNVEVLPEYQRRGIGAALYETVMSGLERFDPRVLRADAFTNLPQGFAFLQKRGFYEAFRETPVHLDIASFDPSPYAGLEPKLLGQGIVIRTLREMEGDPQRDRKLYDVYWEATEDVPQEDFEIPKAPFEEWQAVVGDQRPLHSARRLFHRRARRGVYRAAGTVYRPGQQFNAGWSVGRAPRLSQAGRGPGDAVARDRVCPRARLPAVENLHRRAERADAGHVQQAGLCARPGMAAVPERY